MASHGVKTEIGNAGTVVRRPAVSRALAAWAGAMALVFLLSATGIDFAAGQAFLLAAAAFNALFAVRGLQSGVITISGSNITARTLLHTVRVSPAAAHFEVVQRIGPGRTPYTALAIRDGARSVELREFSTGIRNRRGWLDELASQLNAAVTSVRGPNNRAPTSDSGES